MARKDQIFESFLKHDLLKDKYGLDESKLNINLRVAVKSDVAIIHVIAIIVESLEKPHKETNSAIRNMITQYLDKNAL